MKPVIENNWDITEEEACRLQTHLAKKVCTEDNLPNINTVAGVDVAYDKDSDLIIASIAVLDADTLNIVDTAIIRDQSAFPYVPGLFSFREVPPLIKAFERLNIEPDLVVCDGHGYAHPRRFGLACHLGVLFDIPTIGCGKTRLIGEYNEPEMTRGSRSNLIGSAGEVIGAVLRTQDNIKTVFVSIGHKVSLATSCKWILKLSPKYRLPETTRVADHIGRTQ